MHVHGDFDIVASFDNLIIKPTNGSGGTTLTVILDNEAFTHRRVYRATDLTPEQPDQGITQSDHCSGCIGKSEFDLSCEAPTGGKRHGELRGAPWVTGGAIRRQAALGRAGFGGHSVPLLTAALSSEHPEVQLAALTARGSIGANSPAAFGAIKELTAGANEHIREAASREVMRIESDSYGSASVIRKDGNVLTERFPDWQDRDRAAAKEPR